MSPLFTGIQCEIVIRRYYKGALLKQNSFSSNAAQELIDDIHYFFLFDAEHNQSLFHYSREDDEAWKNMSSPRDESDYKEEWRKMWDLVDHSCSPGGGAWLGRTESQGWWRNSHLDQTDPRWEP
jgi:hypothetical protein